MNDGIPVSFFGRSAMTAPALAVLALRFGCDVLPLRVERLDGARFRVTVFPPLPLPRSGEPHADAAALMTEVNATLEGVDPRPPRAMALGAPTLAGLVSCCYLNRYPYAADLGQRNTGGNPGRTSPWPAQTTQPSVDPGSAPNYG
jgi:hypothetical protein